MQIQKLNPFVYKRKTENGNEYRASNGGKIAAIAIAGVLDTAALIKPKNNFLKNFLTTDTLDCFKIKYKSKHAKAINIIGAIVDIGLCLALGSYVDKSINAKRAQKADLKAQIAKETKNA